MKKKKPSLLYFKIFCSYEALRQCGLYLCLCLVFRVLEEYCRYGILVYRILFSFLLDDDNCDEGFTVLHSGRHEFPFSLELPQT